MFQSGQMGQTVNLLVDTFGGSNPSAPTIRVRVEIDTDSFVFTCPFLRRRSLFKRLEPMTGFEPVTSSLPRKCSTPELHRLVWSDERGSNSRPLAWKANALPTELPSHFFCGRGWIRTTEGINQQIYSLPHLATLEHALFQLFSSLASRPTPAFILSEPLVGFEPTTPRLQITCSGQLS